MENSRTNGCVPEYCAPGIEVVELKAHGVLCSSEDSNNADHRYWEYGGII